MRLLYSVFNGRELNAEYTKSREQNDCIMIFADTQYA